MGPTEQMRLGGTRTVSARVEEGATPGTRMVTFRTEAVPGTLASLAGTLTVARLDIVSAVIQLCADGTVVDEFTVVPLEGSPIETGDGERLAALASSLFEGRRDLGAELRVLRRQYPPQVKMEPRVETHTDSALSTGVNVVCADRPGLLHDIASTLSRYRMRTRSLTVLTFGHKAHDTFRVVDAGGSPPTDETLLAALRSELAGVCC